MNNRFANLIIAAAISLPGSMVASCRLNRQDGQSAIAAAQPQKVQATSDRGNTGQPHSSPTPDDKVIPVIRLNIAAVSIREEDTRLNCEIDVKYPQIADPKTSQQQKFNQKLRQRAMLSVHEFRTFCSDTLKKHPKRMTFSLGADYEVLYATNDLLSLRLKEHSFTGYVNEDYFTETINYDLKAGKEIRLVELFVSEAKYLEVMTAGSIDKLRTQRISCGGGVDEDWLRKGTSPRRENYERWNLVRQGIEITFAEYQIGPGCLGEIKTVIPFKALKEITRANSALEKVAG